TALREAGVAIEDKHASIALHYRLARDRQQAARVIASALDGLSPALRVFGGKLVTNIASVQAHDKSHALADLVALAGAEAAVFVGDDVNDEPVFARAEPAWLTVRVGRDDPASQARYLLDGLADLPGLLDRMLAALPAP
ncbi:MAG: trehalose-phosphatase, partial [Burkholderiaceae bacterium]